MNRASYIVIEESRLVPKDILEAIIKPFLYSRKPPYMLNPEYSNVPELQEEGKISYITSAWFKSEYWYEYVKQTIKKVAEGDEEFGFIALDYLISIYHGIKTQNMIDDERRDIDSVTFSLEYENIPAGQSGKSYYRLNMFPRNMKKAMYPSRMDIVEKTNKNEIAKKQGELRIISVDVATRANKINDNSVLSVIRIIPTNNGYERALIYMETLHGESTVNQARRVKEIFYDFDADYVVLDLMQAGISLFDLMSSVTRNESRGLEYDAWTVYGHNSLDNTLITELQKRTIGVNAKPVIYPIIGSARLNNDIAISFRTSLKNKLWNFLVMDSDGEEYLIKTNKDFSNIKDDLAIRAFYLNPYVQTSFFINECVNLEFNLLNGMIKLSEPPGSYKDRYTSVSYGNWFISLLDIELLKGGDDISDWDAISSLTRFM